METESEVPDTVIKIDYVAFVGDILVKDVTKSIDDYVTQLRLIKEKIGDEEFEKQIMEYGNTSNAMFITALYSGLGQALWSNKKNTHSL